MSTAAAHDDASRKQGRRPLKPALVPVSASLAGRSGLFSATARESLRKHLAPRWTPARPLVGDLPRARLAAASLGGLSAGEARLPARQACGLPLEA